MAHDPQQERDEIEEIQGSRRRMGGRNSLDSPKRGSDRVMQLDAGAQPAAARTWRQRLPWKKAKMAEGEKAEKPVSAVCAPAGNIQTC